MMKTKINLCLTMCIISGIAMTAFTMMCYMKYVNPDSDSLFVTPAPMVTVHAILCAVLVLFALAIPFFLFRKCNIAGETKNTSFVIFSSSLLGFLFGGYVVHVIYRLIVGGSVLSIVPPATEASYSKLLIVLYFIGVVLAVPCAVYFIFIALRKNLSQSPVLCILASSPVLFCAMRLIYTFMETSAKVNSAGRKINIVSLCMCVFFFLYEANIFAPKKKYTFDAKDLEKCSRRYLASGFAAIISLFISRVATILLRAFWLLESGETYIMDAIFITMILYIISRINSLNTVATE